MKQLIEKFARNGGKEIVLNPVDLGDDLPSVNTNRLVSIKLCQHSNEKCTLMITQGIVSTQCL